MTPLLTMRAALSVLASIKSWFGSTLGMIPVEEAGVLGVKQPSRRTPPKRGDDELLRLVVTTPEFTRVALRVAEAFSNVEFYAAEAKGATSRGLTDVLERPNSHLSGRSVRYLEQLWLDTLGESFAVVSVEAGRTYYLPVPPTWVQVDFGSEAPFIVTMGSKQHRFSADEIVWYKRPNPSDPYGRGMGLGRAAADEIETIEYAAKHTKSYFYNDATPSVVFSAKGMTEHQGKAAQAAYEAKHRGFRKAHRTAFMAGEWQLHKLGDSTPGSGALEVRKQLGDVVRSLYSVPPEIIGQLEASNRATITAALDIFARMCLEPRASYYADEVNAKLVPLLERLGVSRGASLGFVSTIPEDVESKREVMKTAPWAFTVNEWRASAGFAPREDGEVYVRHPAKDVVVPADPIIEEKSTGPTGPPPLPARAAGEVVVRLRSRERAPNVIHIKQGVRS